MNAPLLALLLLLALATGCVQQQKQEPGKSVVLYTEGRGDGTVIPPTTVQTGEVPVYPPLKVYTRADLSALSRPYKLANKTTSTSFVSCKTTSMAPTLTCDDTQVLFYPANKYTLAINDIVWYKRGGFSLTQPTTYIFHRIVEKGTDAGGLFYITRPDNPDYCYSPERDETWFRCEDVVRPYWIDYVVAGKLEAGR